MATETGTGSSFITLTYRKEDLPPDNSVSLHTFQKFMKRLRKGLPGVTVRYQASAEYGAPSVEPDPLWASALGRAHYHAIIFGYDFPDKVPFKKHRNHMLYTSPLLTDWWPFGYHWIGSVSFHSARYVASYVMKKLGGDRAEEHYVRTNRITGEVVPVDPEFQVMSKNPGLGQSWFQKYKSDVYPSDFVVIDGKPRKPPRYYDKQLPEAELEAIKRVRRAKSLLKPEERTDERMWTRNLCAALRIERVEKDRELAGHV